jgi:hypothetical protein
VKLRTRIVAWFFLIVWSLAALVSMPKMIGNYGGAFHRHFVQTTLISVFLLLLLCTIVAWARLLARRKWAWWFLVIWDPIIPVIEAALLGSRFTSIGDAVPDLILEAVVLFVLLTDRPSGWGAKSVAADEPTCH